MSAWDDFEPEQASDDWHADIDHEQFMKQKPVHTLPPKNDMNENINAKLADIERREQELKRREAAIVKRELMLERTLAQANPNWPSTCCGMYHHSIGSLPQQYICFTRLLYSTWLLLALTLLSNFLANIMFLVAYDGVAGLKDIMLSGIYFATGIPLSWKLWYYPTYYNFQESNPPSNLRFNFLYGVHLIATGFGATGMKNWACIGWLRLMKSNEQFMTMTCLAVSMCWTLTFVMSLFTITRATKTFAQATLFQSMPLPAVYGLLS